MNKRYDKKQAVAEILDDDSSTSIEQKKGGKNKGQLLVANQHTGPIPTAEEFARYGEVIPDAPERILKVFEEDSKHVRELQSAALSGEISLDRRGQWMAFSTLLGILIIVVYALYLGNVTFAGIASLAFLGMAASGFLKKK